MRTLVPLAVLFLLPSASVAQDKATQDAVDQKLATIRYVRSLQTSTGGFLASVPAPNVRMVPTLRATSAGVRSLKYLTGKPAKEAVPDADKAAAFVLSCFDPTTGGFADTRGGKPDVALTSIGVMAAMELDIPKEKFAKAMDYLKANAKTFEEVRIAAAAVEAWGAKDCPFELKPWFEVTGDFAAGFVTTAKPDDARDMGSVAAFWLRLGHPLSPVERATATTVLTDGQRADGGWGEKGAKASDLATTYRVMRALYLLKETPKDVAKLREFLAKCRNGDGGYGVKPGDPSGVSGVYYVAIINKWLGELEKK